VIHTTIVIAKVIIAKEIRRFFKIYLWYINIFSRNGVPGRT
jgi:hypothetical protein